MAMKKNVNLIYQVDKQENNPYQLEYISDLARSFQLYPSRTKISFRITDIYKFNYFNIVSDKLYLIIQFLLNNGNYKHNYTIFANSYENIIYCPNSSINQIKKLNLLNSNPKNKFISKSTLENLIIKERVYINDNQYTIYRHVNSFYQTDNTMRTLVHNYIYRIVINLGSINLGLLLGGEMYLYGHIFNDIIKNKIYFTDTKSIYLDSIQNDPNKFNSKYFLVNYMDPNCLLSNINICNEQTKSLLISNVSKNGLKRNLCGQIILLKPNNIILIHCNEKAFEQDFNLLKSYYKNIKKQEYETNYKIIISFYTYYN